MKIRKRKLKWNMIVMLTICWFVPLILLSIAMLVFVDTKISKQLENTIVTSADKAIEICQMRIEEAIKSSQKASYLPTVKESYLAYKEGGAKHRLSHDITLFMDQQYRYNSDLNMTAIYFTEYPDEIYYCYNNGNKKGTWAAVQAFNNYAREKTQEKAKGIDTSVAFMNIEGRLYLIRNIVDSSFHPIAVIIMDLNVDSIFGSLDSIWCYMEADVFIDGESMRNIYEEDPCKDIIKERIMKRADYHHSSKGSYVYKRVESSRHKFAYAVTLDSWEIISEMDTIKYMFYLFLAFMIPLVIMVFWFFHKRVNVPISELNKACKEIEQEKYGYQIEITKKDEEFYYLDEAFNSMSNKLKYQFEKIYMEELALKDANIMALQSQINPHFLNNTLEIINWEARMTGNYKVSGMIEALSTMLEATMNRKSEPLITLSEEISYVEAYLHIIAHRYGDNFEAEKEYDENLMRIKVPRLIIQPIIENAVEHGMDIRHKGKIKIIVRREEDKLYIEVIDNGKLSEEDKKKIRILLNEDSTSGTQSLSLGIRNVNKRLKIIYGEDCGLTIKSNKDGFTVSTIMVKIDKAEEQ